MRFVNISAKSDYSRGLRVTTSSLRRLDPVGWLHPRFPSSGEADSGR